MRVCASGAHGRCEIFRIGDRAVATRDEEFLKKLFAAFRIEADEHVKAISSGLLELEKTSTGDEAAAIVETVYREAHSLKGAARSVNMIHVESVCQAMESVLGALKGGRLKASTTTFDVLHGATDAITDLLAGSESVEVDREVEEVLGLLKAPKEDERTEAAVKPERRVETVPASDESTDGAGEAEQSSEAEPAGAQEDRHDVEESQQSVVVSEAGLESADTGGERGGHANAPGESPRFAGPMQSDTVRIAVEKLDPLLRQVEEMVSVKLTSAQRVADLVSLATSIATWKQKWGSVIANERSMGSLLLKKGSHNKSDLSEAQLTKLTDFLDWNETFVKSVEARLKELARSAESDSRTHGSMVDDLLEDMMNVLMLPCSSLVEVFPKLVRDLSREAGKEVYLEIRGADLEIDRRILEAIKDPLIHLVRNAIDHGIEPPDVRESVGKPARGNVTIAFSQISGNQVELTVSDDGGGIDVQKVRDVALSRGIISQQEKTHFGEQEAIALVFRSEVSTSSGVTRLSGRGLGLAIVREKLENLGGNVSVFTAPRQGTSFRILLPVTLSTFRGILVESYNQPFIVPTANVERVARIKREIIKTVGNKETIEVDGKAIPLVKLGETLQLRKTDGKNGHTDFIPVLILRSGESVVSFSVDKIVQEQEVLVKPFNKQLSRVRNVAGATMLGTGNLVPILNVQDLVKSATKRTFTPAGPAIELEETEDRIKNVLVVEDSITSRMLLKNILETSGYSVTTSVDGADAWTVLKTNSFDLVVSDVEMPRMNGFELTAHIRSDEALSDLPVILVTSLGSREDRERGIDAGANAYIVKGSFDQNNLLDTVERLV